MDRPRAKLRALCEPMTLSDYRLHLSWKSAWGTCAGGALRTVHGGLRRDPERLYSALHLLELLDRLTPDRQPNAAKFDLLAAALGRLEAKDAPGPVVLAYTVRLLDLVGHRVPVPQDGGAWWDLLHGAAWDGLADIPGPARARHAAWADKFLKTHLDRPLKTDLFLESLHGEKDLSGAAAVA